MYIFDWRDIDINDPSLTDKEQLMMKRSMEKVAQYLRQGRSMDAHGAAAVVMIAYHILKGIDPMEDSSAMVPL